MMICFWDWLGKRYGKWRHCWSQKFLSFYHSVFKAFFPKDHVTTQDCFVKGLHRKKQRNKAVKIIAIGKKTLIRIS